MEYILKTFANNCSTTTNYWLQVAKSQGNNNNTVDGLQF